MGKSRNGWSMHTCREEERKKTVRKRPEADALVKERFSKHTNLLVLMNFLLCR